MAEMSQATARLRMFLAEATNREKQLDQLVRQFNLQLKRLPRQAIYGRTPLDLSLSAMGEVEERLNDALATRERLRAVKKQAEEEIQALEVTRQVEEAKQSLEKLRLEQGIQDSSEGVAEEIKRLEQFINDYSKMAERAITAMYEENGP